MYLLHLMECIRESPQVQASFGVNEEGGTAAKFLKTCLGYLK